jgi:hypothetical protein
VGPSVHRPVDTQRLEQFLRQVDAELARPCTIVLIGGAALSLGYRSTHATTDMDLWAPSRGPFWTAVEKVKKRAPTSVPIERATIRRKGRAQEPLEERRNSRGAAGQSGAYRGGIRRASS